jgi:putative ABC transport system permease protein
MRNVWRDFRFGFRLLRKNKAFAAVAVFALAVGIGPNTAIFSVIYSMVLAPMPYPHAEQLVMVWSKIQGFRNSVSAGDYLDWKNQSKSFQQLVAWSGFNSNLGGPEGPEQVPGTAATPGILTMHGVKPMLGRDFLPNEDQPGKNHVVILMNGLWQRRFGGRTDIIGQNIRINGEQYTVVGVLPPGQQDRMPNQLWVPLTLQPEQINHDFHSLLVMGRLKPGVTIKQAQADMDSVTKHIAEVYPANKGWSSSVEPLRNNFVAKETFTTLWLLMGGVGFVLLIACANVANLLLARGAARQREVAVRSSLGASRGQIFAQLMAESLALAIIGGVIGVALGWAVLRILSATMPPNTLPSEADLTLNVPVLLFTLGATLLSGIIAGCVPAWRNARQDLNETLKQSGRALTGGGQWLRRVLVVGEFALALTLLAGAALAIHSFWKITQLDYGVRTDHILTFGLPVPDGKLKDATQVANFYQQVLSRIDALPGITSAAVTTGIPLQGPGFGMQFSIAGKPVADPSARPGAGYQMVSPGYFKTFGVRVTQGRAIDERDVAGGVRVAMVDENFAKRYMKDMDPLRQRVVIEEIIPGATKLGPPIQWQIVGVFQPVQYGGRPDSTFPVIYVPFAQTSWPSAAMAVRTSGDPASMTKSLAAAVHSVDPDLPLADPATMDQIVARSRAGDRFGMVLYGSFAAIALLLAALGIYGVISYLVTQRTHEIGLRMALGAGRMDILRMVMGEGMMLAVSGLVLGLGGAWLVGRMMQSMLFGVTALDVPAFAAVGLVLLMSAILACYIPARRAVWVEPLEALRQD